MLAVEWQLLSLHCSEFTTGVHAVFESEKATQTRFTVSCHLPAFAWLSLLLLRRFLLCFSAGEVIVFADIRISAAASSFFSFL